MLIHPDWEERFHSLADARRYLDNAPLEFGWNVNGTDTVHVEQLGARVVVRVWNDADYQKLRASLVAMALEPVYGSGKKSDHWPNQEGKKFPLINDLLAWWIHYRADGTKYTSHLHRTTEIAQWLKEFHENPPVAVHTMLYNEYEDFKALFLSPDYNE